MSERTINLDEIINSVILEDIEMVAGIDLPSARHAMTEAIRQALEIAAEEAEARIGYESDIERLIDYKVARVDKQSILNVIERVKG